MSEKDLLNVRTALLITLSVLLVAILWRRFRQRVLANDMPAALHAELLGVELAYHPARLHVHLKVPGPQEIRTALLDAEHRVLHHWPHDVLPEGSHRVERDLPLLADGVYHLEISTTTQRTVRQFRLQQA